MDCGISCKRREVEAVKADGIDVVIADHHEPGSAVPEGVPVADQCDQRNAKAYSCGPSVLPQDGSGAGGRPESPICA